VPNRNSIIRDLSRIKYEAERFLLKEPFDLYEDGRIVAQVVPPNYAIEVAYNKLIFSCWGEGWSRSWRVIGCETGESLLRLHCTKQMGRLACVVELRRGVLTGDIAATRAKFTEKMAVLIESNLPGITVERVTLRRDDYRHLSGVHTRLILKERQTTIAAVAIGQNESPTHIDATLSAGIIWLNELLNRGRRVNQLMIFLPLNCALPIACRLVYIHLEGMVIRLYEIDEEQRRITPIAPFDQADLADKLQQASRRADWSQKQNDSLILKERLAQVKKLAPDDIEEQQRSGWIYLSIRGLNYARISTAKAKLEFGIERPRQQLTEENRAEFESLVLRLNALRRAGNPDRSDELFRLQPERWLESLICKNVAALDPLLDARFAYRQVPAYRGEERSFIDVLTATHKGRLVVIELKVSEDAEFPFQGLDYWSRVDWHRQRGDFQKRGYFEGLTLTDEAPLLYLVAPLFRFHAATKMLAAAISSKIPVYRIGINEDWRSAIRVLLHERLN
jgi:hypothetical protein